MGRENPEEVLAKVKRAEEKKRHGQLKIFFGYAAGVGKTYAMLQAAHQIKAQGIDVICGYIESHERPETLALLTGLEVFPRRIGNYQGMALQEPDLDGLLTRQPQVVLLDELAHTNAPFCRHKKRFQDAQELLRAGIDVYTSINVQHIESLNDQVAAITGIVVQERIPDEVFDEADQVELVDLEPEELLDRLRAGKIYPKAAAALANFFVPENLTALREMALRRMADRVSRREAYAAVPVAEHILIGLSPSPSNAKVIRTAARLAAAFDGKFTALFVESAAFSRISSADQQRLSANIQLARSFGANIVTVYGEDIAAQIAEYVRQARVSKVVLGRSMTKRRLFSPQATFSERLAALAPQLDIYIIPDRYQKEFSPEKSAVSGAEQNHPWQWGRDLAVVAASLTICTLLGLLLHSAGLPGADIVLLYILAALIPAFFTTGLRYSLLVSLGSVLLFNFFFTAPRYTFEVYTPGYPVSFSIFFLVSFTTGFLTRKIRGQMRLAAQKAYRTEILLETSGLLQAVEGRQEIFRVLAEQLTRLLQKDVVFYDGENFYPQFFTDPVGEVPRKDFSAMDEQALAHWVLKNNKHAGATTNTLPGASGLYLTIRGRAKALAVVGIALGKSVLTPFEYNVVISLLSSGALALDKEDQRQKRHAIEMEARQEQLRSNLLRGISHDLRTPLTAIAGNAELLMQANPPLEETQRLAIGQEISQEARWLVNMIENILSVTRIQNGAMQLELLPEVLQDVLQEAVRHVSARAKEHPITIDSPDPYLLVKADSRLLIQVFVNLFDNAIKYTPVGTPITVSVKKIGGFAAIEVADTGGGIPQKEKGHIFDMFTTGKATHSDSRRGLGIGLALCQAIVVAHGGSISVRDNHPQGTIFRFTLHIEEA